MISTILIGFVVLAVAFLSAENLVVSIAGAIGTYVLTNVIKNATGIYRIGALALAVVVSVAVAAVAQLISSYFGGEPVSVETIGAAMPKIFALATIAYKVLTELESNSK